MRTAWLNSWGSMRLNERFDRFSQFWQPSSFVGHLLIETQTPSDVSTSRFAMERVQIISIDIHLASGSNTPCLKQPFGLATQSPSNLVERDLRVVLHSQKTRPS
jgi:hypothetical protein